MLNHATPEEIAAAGILPISQEDVRKGTIEYFQRIKDHLPVFAPAFKVGDWAYNPVWKQNQRVVRIEWDDGFPGCSIPQWRYHVPGYGTTCLSSAFENAPFVEYERTASGSYRPIEGDVRP